MRRGSHRRPGATAPLPRAVQSQWMCRGIVRMPFLTGTGARAPHLYPCDPFGPY